MGDPKGFLKVKRQAMQYRPVCERVKDYKEVIAPVWASHSKDQASRCMDCGTPFCHWGCPVGNYIPEWNDAVFTGKWQKAIDLLHAANNLPEITGRICPSLCEYACVLGINDDPVTIRENELAIIEHAFKAGFIKPRPPKIRTKKKVAVIGSGPAGLACADQLNKAGHNVIVFEKDDLPGGIMRYGIPDFKLKKSILDRRINIFKKEGMVFKLNSSVNIKPKGFDAIVLAGGCRVPRDLNIPGRDLKGIYFAMDYLTQSNMRVRGEKIADKDLIDAKSKSVVVIGGGDTGSDCVGTANRQGAKCVVQIELLPQPSTCRPPNMPWPKYPLLLKTSSSHEEGADRKWSVNTKEFAGENGCVRKLMCVSGDNEFEIGVDLVILAMGFLHPEKTGMIKELDIQLDNRGNIRTDDNYMTPQKGIFAAGDMRRGQSLIVWAISEGRCAAYCVDKYLMGSSGLPIL
ncbi:MAG: glutamate synthase [Candidatus Omnitrophica bacterium CG12_big_fil_rev_8_21_14_0_65_43_15]|uniref:Glutamate synthase n=1 Tax=Candidatus Taenaricola geysiri TaxID=1974752 RepID=A0A2J0LLS7_9BACT|nr:MAG: glutamate synthase [Candidatus Omnitrophica bacterium CG12_big_fil_rev_8_21_14_0_65_43_15]